MLGLGLNINININFLKTYFTLIMYIVAFCQLFIKDMMDGWMDNRTLFRKVSLAVEQRF